ncbi:MAG: hypothetical protein K2F83_07485, partial [Oscillospiraceae bacterium]|nr:hypothetical protein [Oscillospiraceae bacterium]
SSAIERLFDRENNLVKLFDPPFDCGEQDPGYIKGYLPGIRENGGQYTHAATWLALACFRDRRSADGLSILNALLPAGHPQEIYLAEPYVLAGDVYSHPNHIGRGGWSWYTGAAGWYYQAAVRGLLGIKVKDGLLTLDSVLPKDWPGWQGEWMLEHGYLTIEVKRGKSRELLLDGTPVEGVDLKGLTGQHRLELILS